MESFRPLSSFPDIGSTPPKPYQHRTPDAKAELSFRSAMMGMLLVFVFLSGGLYFFGSSLNQTAGAREGDRLARDELAGFTTELESQEEAHADEASLNAAMRDAEQAAIQEFDLLNESE